MQLDRVPFLANHPSNNQLRLAYSTVTYHSSLLDETKQAKAIQRLGLFCRELHQLLTVLAAQNSSGATDDKGNTSKSARIPSNHFFALDGFQFLDANAKVQRKHRS